MTSFAPQGLFVQTPILSIHNNNMCMFTHEGLKLNIITTTAHSEQPFVCFEPLQSSSVHHSDPDSLCLNACFHQLGKSMLQIGYIHIDVQSRYAATSSLLVVELYMVRVQSTSSTAYPSSKPYNCDALSESSGTTSLPCWS